MSETNIDSMLNSYLRDAHAMEQNVRIMLESMIQTTPDADLRGVLAQHSAETKQQIERLEECLERRGESTTGLKDAAAMMGAFFKGMADVVRSDKAGKNARDGYVTEALEIASYQLLERLAERAGDRKTAGVARTNRAEEEAMRERIDGNWDRYIALVLEEAGVTI
jgi:ferritin-like metal-binding protein YciE